MPKPPPKKVFISYSRKDEQHMDRLRIHLKPLEREGLIEPWHDRMIAPGTNWQHEIDENLAAAEIVLLLVSPDFVASDYAYDREATIALYRHDRDEACVIPIIVAPVNLAQTPFAKIQVLPRDARPISTWPNQDEAWLDVEQGIRRTIDWLAEQRRLADNVATTARRVALRIASLRGRRTQFALLVAAEAARRSATPELWSELAASITTCPVRPLPATLPCDTQHWVPSSDFRRALLWSNRGLGRIVDLETGAVLAELRQTNHASRGIGSGDPGSFSPDGRLIAAVGRVNKPREAHTEETRQPPPRRSTDELGIWDAGTGRLLARVANVIGSATFSTNGREVLVDYAENPVIIGLDDVSLVSLRDRPPSGHNRRGRRNPDGGVVLAVHTEDRNAHLVSKNETRALIGHEHRIIHGDWSPDGTHILTCARDSTGRIWSPDGQLQATFRAHQGPLTWGDWHPNGRCVATVDEYGGGWIWEIDGKPRCSLPATSPSTLFCQWSPTGQRLVVWPYEGGPLRVFDDEGRLLTELLDDLNFIKLPRWHPDGTTLFGIGESGRVRRWSTRQEPLAALAPNGTIVAADFTPDGKGVLAVDAGAAEAAIWNLDGQRLCAVPVRDAMHVKMIAQRSDGAQFLTVSCVEGARIWDREGMPTGTLKGHDNHQRHVWCAAWSPVGDRILTASTDGAARLWNTEGDPIAVLGDHFYGCYYAAFSPDGRRAFTVCAAGHLRLWDIAGPFIPISNPPAGTVTDPESESPRQGPNFHFGPYDQNGTLVFAPGDDWGPVVDQGAPLLAQWSGAARNLYVGRWPRFSPDGQLILLPSGRALEVPKDTPASPVRCAEDWLFDRFSDQHLWALDLTRGGRHLAHDACFSADGARIATAHEDAARIWDRKGQLLHELKGHVASVWKVCFSPDGRRLLTVVDEGRVLQLWDTGTGRWMATFPGPPDAILDACFSATGSHILVHAARTIPGYGIITAGYVWIWPADLAGLVALAQQRSGRVLTEDERRLYLDP